MSMVPRSFFSVELCFPFTTAFAVHGEVRRVLARTSDDVPLANKWENHKAIADILLRHIDTATHGCWEYFDDDGDDRMWDDWLLPMSDRSRQPAGKEAGGYFTVTMMMQVRRHTPTDKLVAGAFHAVGDALWTRGTFAAMLRAIPAVSFANVVRDALYLMPRDDNKGFTDDELKLERMEYLRVLS